MRCFWLFLSSSLFLLGFSSCKKETYDPSKYNSLLYSYTPAPPPSKEYIFNATVGGAVWNTTGLALISGDTMEITGTMGTQTLLLKIVGFTSNQVFSIGHNSLDSSALSSIGNTGFDYASVAKSHGTVTVKNLDKTFDQIEAHFDLVLYNSAGDDSLVVTNGYFKINFTSNDIRWIENGNEVIADSVWANDVDATKWEVYGWDSTTHHQIKLVVPKNPSLGFGLALNLKTAIPLPAAFYALSNSGAPIQASSGNLVVKSNGSSVVKGTFGVGSSIKFTASPTTYFVTKGSFSAKY